MLGKKRKCQKNVYKKREKKRMNIREKCIKKGIKRER